MLADRQEQPALQVLASTKKVVVWCRTVVRGTVVRIEVEWIWIVKCDSVANSRTCPGSCGSCSSSNGFDAGRRLDERFQEVLSKKSDGGFYDSVGNSTMVSGQ